MPLPTGIAIPSLDVTSDLQRLGRDADGAIEIPSRWQVAGWYAEGVRPGQVGPAVILGHVDSRRGPAVFYRLRELRRGDTIDIARRDGSIVTFVVDRLERHAKTRFPTDDVYLPTLEPTLRLVTCDGTFDSSTGHYRDNLVVFATLRA
ncbi:MAG TPA: class F sortase [Euzebyales bacterium]|nr:class F sortase [Euzebyales bacterium]